MGQNVYVVGSIPELGLWKVRELWFKYFIQPERGVKMTTNAGLYPTWKMDNGVIVLTSQVIEYKYVI